MPVTKSTEQHKADGTYKPCRHDGRIDTNLKKLQKVPKPPTHFNQHAKKKFTELCKKYIDNGLMAELYLETIEVIAIHYGMYRECYDAVYTKIEDGKIVKQTLVEYMKGRNSQTALELTQLNKSLDAYNKVLKSFGSNPVDATKIRSVAEIKKEKEDDRVQNSVLRLLN